VEGHASEREGALVAFGLAGRMRRLERRDPQNKNTLKMQMENLELELFFKIRVPHRCDSCEEAGARVQ
jgi:hypothetical protein